MKDSLSIPPSGALDFLSLGAVVHRLDPGIVPFAKRVNASSTLARRVQLSLPKLADCFRLNTGGVTHG